MGNIGEASTACETFDNYTLYEYVSFDLYCDAGTLMFIKELGALDTSKSVVCSTDDNISFMEDCDIYNVDTSDASSLIDSYF